MSGAKEELRFERLERLGAGGMAVVWRALDRKLRREVALKELHEEIAFSSEGLARFRHEAEAIARLSHPNVVAFFDAADEGPRTVLVLELVRGLPLDKLLAKNAPPLKTLVGILEKVARGVHHAHEQGVIHRDLKPSNILVGEDGEPKVSDFGLAHLSGDMITTLTKTGALLGTPAYMSPEQARGDRHTIDRRTDVYALGAILYEALAGTPPFRAPSVHALVHEVIHKEPVEPRFLRSDVPLDLQTIALKCLSKEQDRRYPGALEVAEELRRWLDGRPIQARPPSRTELLTLWVRRNRTLSLLLGVTLLATIGGSAAGGLNVQARLAREREVEDRARAVTDELARIRAAKDQGDRGEVRDLGAAVDRVVALDSERTVDILEAALGATTAELASATRAVYMAANELTPEEERAGSRPIAGLEATVDRLLATGVFEERDIPIFAQCVKRIEDRVVRSLPPGGDSKAADMRTLVAAEQRRRVSEGQRRVATFACEALGRLKRSRSVRPIERYLGVVAHELDACSAGEALVRIGGADADGALLGASRRFGTSSLFWTRVGARQNGATGGVANEGPAPVKPVAVVEGPVTAEDFKKRGVARASKRDLDGAIADLTSSIALDSKDAFAWYNRAAARLEKKDLDGSLADASRAVQLRPSDGGMLGFRGNVRKIRGDAKGALKDLERAVELDPERTTTRIYLGQTLHATGDYRAAIAALTSALAIDPNSLQALNSRGISRKYAKDPEGAIADWTHALELDPDFAAALSNRGGILAERGELDAALLDLTRAIDVLPRNVEALANRGRVHQRRGDFEAALADLGRAIEIAPRYVPARMLRAQVKKDGGDFEGAIEDLERAHEIAPKQASVLNDLATMRRMTNDLDGSLRDYGRALVLEPRNPQIVWNRGLVRGLLGDRKGEIEDATRAIELDPTRQHPYQTRGIARAKEGDKEGALADGDRAVDLAPADSSSWSARATVKRIIEDHEGAVADATRALELAPRDADAFGTRGRARAALGDRPGAIADLERYLELSPAGSASRAVKEALETLRKP